MIFGKNEYHGGIDMVGIDDDTVYAISDGKAEVLFEDGGFGLYIRQTLDDGRRVYYAHLDSTKLQSGTDVYKGMALGIMGSTGKSTGAHLHIELRPKGTSKESLDIAKYLGIDNALGIYTSDINRYSYDNTVNSLIECGIVTVENMVSWELMLSGRAPLNKDYVRTVFDRCCNKISEYERMNV